MTPKVALGRLTTSPSTSVPMKTMETQSGNRNIKNTTATETARHGDGHTLTSNCGEEYQADINRTEAETNGTSQADKMTSTDSTEPPTKKFRVEMSGFEQEQEEDEQILPDGMEAEKSLISSGCKRTEERSSVNSTSSSHGEIPFVARTVEEAAVAATVHHETPKETRSLFSGGALMTPASCLTVSSDVEKWSASVSQGKKSQFSSTTDSQSSSDSGKVAKKQCKVDEATNSAAAAEVDAPLDVGSAVSTD
ncbi:hypothetical protein AB6A40_008986 [Gnathostoma spinigerum]|uniref:Uncharacterized protein n=1 Tax=Gnathostoma spinigerum TaxID=75299 RepID=A0ABD6EZQ2_9BILA